MKIAELTELNRNYMLKKDLAERTLQEKVAYY